jgi:hypothetical protein
MVKLFDLRPEIRFFRKTTEMSVFGNKFAPTDKKHLKILECLLTLVFLQTIKGKYLKNILFLMKF